MIMRKPAFNICENKGENKGTDQLHCNHLFLLHSKTPLKFQGYKEQFLYFLNPKFRIQNFEPLTLFNDCTALLVSDLYENPEDRFSCDGAHLFPMTKCTSDGDLIFQIHPGFQHMSLVRSLCLM